MRTEDYAYETVETVVVEESSSRSERMAVRYCLSAFY